MFESLCRGLAQRDVLLVLRVRRASGCHEYWTMVPQASPPPPPPSALCAPNAKVGDNHISISDPFQRTGVGSGGVERLVSARGTGTLSSSSSTSSVSGSIWMTMLRLVDRDSLLYADGDGEDDGRSMGGGADCCDDDEQEAMAYVEAVLQEEFLGPPLDYNPMACPSGTLTSLVSHWFVWW